MAPLYGLIPIEFILFGLTLLVVALVHHHTLRVSLFGLAAIVLYKFFFTGFRDGPGLPGLTSSFAHEWVVLTNLLALLTGFALVADFFERSHLPARMPKFLPRQWKGGLALLVLIWILSSFLDNIAGALIGGALAHQLFRGKVHIGFVAAIVAAANAGGAWSVVGDTTTTMMWISGISPAHVFHAVIAAVVALFVFGIPAALMQEKYAPLEGSDDSPPAVDRVRVAIVIFVLLLAVATNAVVNLKFPELAERFPFIGVALWLALALSTLVRRPTWSLLPRALRGSIFLLSLVMAAALMPVEKLPTASWPTAFCLGLLSAVFDNIPLTALALKQGSYDWGVLAYAVGFGGSMIWFGSSAGVALCNMYPEARSVGRWLRYGWAIPLAYVIGFFVMLAFWGWHPEIPSAR